MVSGQFSLVVALYNAAEYVPAFLESLRTQRYPLHDLDIVVVDDGSTDDSAEIVERWARRYHPGLRLIRQENAGPGAARNVGLRLARNTWVNFCDPDDAFHPRYFQEIKNFLEGDVNGVAQLLAARLVQFQDGSVKLSHKHPLGQKFRAGNRLVSLDDNPEYIQLHGPTAFLRRSVLQAHGLEFDERIRPKFEDSHLIARYLAATGKPVLGIVSSARYLYRRNRQHGASLVAGAWADPRAYDELPRYGYLGLLHKVRETLGHVPHWAQYMVLYDLVWFYRDDKEMHSLTAAATEQQRDTMHMLLEQTFSLIDDEVIEQFSVVSQGWVFHNILRSYYKHKNNETPVVQSWHWNHLHDLGFGRYTYFFQGELPEEKLFVNGVSVEPEAAKIREHQVLGRTLIRERVLVLPKRKRIEILLDGIPATITRNRGVPKQDRRWPKQLEDFVLRPPAVPEGCQENNFSNTCKKLSSYAERFGDNIQLRSSLTGRGKAAEAFDTLSQVARRPRAQKIAKAQDEADKHLVSVAAQEPAASLYRNAWLLMDRIDRADDNAEHLYRYLVRERPDVNVWFVLDRKCRDWDRLESDGFKLVAYGSDELVLLYLNAVVKVSSHANANIEFPVSKGRFGPGNARFIFLQHGVIKDDLSSWLNTKSIARMITSSSAEHDSIVGDGSTYNITSHEVRLTGLARHDALLRAAKACPTDKRKSILVAPTWRQYLRTELDKATTDAARVQVFENSKFGRAWLQLLRSSELRSHCLQQGFRIVFLPHPELEGMVSLLDLPDHVHPAAYTDIAVQEVLVNTHTLVTDFSSIAFDGAYAGSRVLYMQPDADEIYGGGHVYRKGYFDYVKDGFGPLTSNADDAVDYLTKPMPAENEAMYRDRVRNTFKYWDSRSCERITAVIEELVAP